ncbi:hypothetical protein [Bradyrhizobium sp. STM 3557]|uniref:hypothetical protein n=1 Tax=Bradyrhizobium sp. STM 3557 TaxID=578920 RepID=UPI00388DAB21
MFSIWEIPFSPWQPAQISLALALPAAMSAACAIEAPDKHTASKLPIRIFRIISSPGIVASLWPTTLLLLIGGITIKTHDQNKGLRPP